MKNIKTIFILSAFIFMFYNSNAGWIVKQQNYDSDQGVETAVFETVYLQDNIMKVQQDKIITIFNLNDETITLMNTANKVFWKGKVADYKKDVKSAMQATMDEQLAKASAEQKEMIRKMYTSMMESIDNPSKFAGEEPEEYEIEIERTGEKERIAGRMAVKYKVLINGSVKEEAWLSESERANAEFDSEQFHTVYGDFISQAETIAYYQSNEKYIEFSKKGFPLKSINYYGGYESISEVIELKRENIEKSAFEIPADYKKVSITEIGLDQE